MTESNYGQGGSGSPMHRATWGIVLITLGTFFLLDRLDILEVEGLWRFWPLILIALGAAKLLSPGRDGRRGGGVWMLLVGVCALFINFDLFGLTWGSAWPLFIIVAGLSITFEALFDRRRASGENEHVR